MGKKTKRNPKHDEKTSSGREQASPESSVHPALKRHTGFCYFKTASKFRALVDELLEPEGVIAPQLGVLSLLDNLGSMNQIELGEVTRVDKATMVRLLDGLEEKGYLRRVNEKTDRRAKRLEITSLGKERLKRMIALRERAEERFFEVLTKEERAVFKEIVRKLAEAHL